MPKTKVFDAHLDRYEEWFIKHELAFEAELNAFRRAFFDSSKGLQGVEIGVGSGIFAEKLGVGVGVEPSSRMIEMANQRGIAVIRGIGEAVPLRSKAVDFVLLVTTICFVDDLNQVLREVWRILRDNGKIVVGFVDKDSLLGQFYLKNKDKSVFYRDAIFYSTTEVEDFLARNGFQVKSVFQTLFDLLENIKTVDPVIEGHGEGGFVVIVGEKID